MKLHQCIFSSKYHGHTEELIMGQVHQKIIKTVFAVLLAPNPLF